jgi:hypothetical protein
MESAKWNFDVNPRFHLSKPFILQISKPGKLALAAKLTFLEICH